MKRGFSLLEMILALTFITLAIFPILYFSVSGLRVSRDVEGTLEAVNLAGKRIEEIMSLSFGVITSEARSAIAEFPGYFRETVVTEEAASKLKTIQVNVYWIIGGVETNYSLSTIRTNP